MGRAPTRNKHLPAGMRARHRPAGTYYYLDTGEKPRREIPLGSDYVTAVQKWAELTAAKAAAQITFKHVTDRYIRDELPKKAPATRKDNLRELAKLLEFFEDAPLDEIDPIHVRQYIDWRGQTAKIRANREKALFSHIWNFARDKGITSKTNPAAGIRGNPEVGRDAYIEDTVYQAVWAAAEVPLQDAMDLAYLTGQRPADVLKLSSTDIQDGELTVVQNKTGKRLRIAIEGELATVIDRIKARKVAGMTLITRQGKVMTKAALRGAFDRARDAAILANPGMEAKIRAFQFRDLRAKAGTDTEETRGMAAAKDQLGHSSEVMTSHYVRHRRGKLVKPTK
jgi:integrase